MIVNTTASAHKTTSIECCWLHMQINQAKDHWNAIGKSRLQLIKIES